MPKKAASRKSKKKEVFFVGLFLVDLDLETNPALETSEDVSISYAVKLNHPAETEEEVYTFQTTISVAKRQKDESGEEDKNETLIQATYLSAMQCHNCDKKEISDMAKDYAMTVIWGNFTSLSALLTQQMRATFPLLPAVPSFVFFDEESNEKAEPEELEA